MAENAEHGPAVLDAAPIWWVGPEQTDWMSWAALAMIALAVYLLMTIYVKFDRWAEQKSHGTPLAKTIPTLLTIALLYEVFPLDHFHALLPFTAILLALMADWVRARQNGLELIPFVPPPSAEAPESPEPAAASVPPQPDAPVEAGKPEARSDD